MAYPMQNMYLTEMEYEKDLERMKEFYPAEVSRIQEEVSKRCDALEYEGSRIYDEEPDRLMFQLEVDRLCDKLKEEYSTTWLRSMISILLSDEIYKRRCKRRRCRRFWY